MPEERSLASSSICTANSLVGETTRALLLPWERIYRWNMVKRKTAVFPLPVLDCTMTSLPFSATGRTFSCTKVHSLNPALSTPMSIWGSRFSSLNIICFSNNTFSSERVVVTNDFVYRDINHTSELLLVWNRLQGLRFHLPPSSLQFLQPCCIRSSIFSEDMKPKRNGVQRQSSWPFHTNLRHRCRSLRLNPRHHRRFPLPQRWTPPENLPEDYSFW